MEVSFVRLEMNLAREATLWLRRMLSYLKQSEANELKEWIARSEESLELFAVKQGKFGAGWKPRVEMWSDSMQ